MERLTLQQPHREQQKRRRRLFAVKDLIDGTQVRMNDLAGENHFLLKAIRARGVRGDFGPDNLEGHAGALEELVLRFIDLAHTSASDETNDQKAIGDPLCGLKASGSGDFGGGLTCCRLCGK